MVPQSPAAEASAAGTDVQRRPSPKQARLTAVHSDRHGLSGDGAVVRFAVRPVSSPGLSPRTHSRTAVAVIPARYHSTRLPGKALADIGGRPMIEHVYRRASDARSVASVIVATDDERIAAAVRAFGGDAVMTSPDHRSGTDRLAEVAADARLRSDRERPGGRTADRAGDDRRGRRAVRDDPALRDEHAAAPHRRSARARESERHQGRRRSATATRSTFRARRSRSRVRRRTARAGVAARRPLRLTPRLPAALAGLPPTPTREIGGARAAARARARHQDQGARDALRLDRRRHAGRPRAGARIMAAAAPARSGCNDTRSTRRRRALPRNLLGETWATST